MIKNLNFVIFFQYFLNFSILLCQIYFLVKYLNPKVFEMMNIIKQKFLYIINI